MSGITFTPEFGRKESSVTYKCNGCQSVEIHSSTSQLTWKAPSYISEYVRRRCRIKRLELDARQEVKRGVDVDVDHPLMIEYRQLLREHWNGA